MKPSNFKSDPMGSVLQEAESETIARNIMVILARTGDIFRPLSWKEYKTEREKDKDFSSGEKSYFEVVIDYCKSPDTARLFSPVWEQAYLKAQKAAPATEGQPPYDSNLLNPDYRDINESPEPVKDNQEGLRELLKTIYHEIDIDCISETNHVTMDTVRNVLVKHGANEPDLW